MRTLKTSELYDMGIIFNSFNMSSPTPIHHRETILGRNGFIDLGTNYDGRTIDTKVTIMPKREYSQLRNEIFQIFDSRELFYIIHDEDYKRWLVKYSSPFTFSRSGDIGETNIQLISPNVFAESVGTTLDPITFRNEPNIKDLGLNLTEKDYIHTTNVFKIYNPGERIDPRELGLKIHFTGASSNLSIKNNTNATEWIYNASTIDTDVILLDGIKSYKNGVSIFRDTNYGVIELENGWNEFTINGATDFEIKFEHRFYYL